MRRSLRASPSWSNLRLLSANLSRRLVFPKTFERRLTHKVIRGPGRKVHLSHQLGPHPQSPALCLCRHLLERACLLAKLIKLIPQNAMRLLREACPRSPCIDQFPLVVVVPKQQRTHSVAPIRRQRKAPDDKLLLMNALQLQPVAAAAARILTRSPLGDAALRMQLTPPLG